MEVGCRRLVRGALGSHACGYEGKAAELDRGRSGSETVSGGDCGVYPTGSSGRDRRARLLHVSATSTGIEGSPDLPGRL